VFEQSNTHWTYIANRQSYGQQTSQESIEACIIVTPLGCFFMSV